MKKTVRTISLVAAVAILATLCATAAFAAGSKTDIVEVVPTDSSKAVTIGDASVTLDAETAAKLLNDGTKAEQMKVIWCKDVTGPTPNELTFKTDLASNQKGYVYHYVNGAWTLIGSVNTPITVSDYSPFGVAIKTTDSEGVANTGDNNMTIALVCGGIAAVAAVGVAATVSLKKKKA